MLISLETVKQIRYEDDMLSSGVEDEGNSIQ